MKRSYELMFVFRADADITDKTAPEKIAKLIGTGVSVDSVTVVGKKQLAYPIKKQTEGMYVLSVLSGKVYVPDLEKRVQVDTSVLRYLVTTK